HKGNFPPDKCPVCNVGAKKFKEIDEIPVEVETSNGKLTKKKSKTIKTNNFKKIKSLLVKHHAHPVAVHTPNGLLPVAVILWLFAWFFDSQLLAKTAFINQIFVLISLPFVIVTGVFEWQKKYNQAYTMMFKIKILTAALASIACLISTVWFLVDPEILFSTRAWGFMLINIIMLADAGVAGHIGGKLVFKD
ncbi:MAG: rubredoxin, partial [Desulfobacula sp.]|nr:rubredoxin [Desulfobacula sp.]